MESLKKVVNTIFMSTFAQCGYDPSFGAIVESQRPDLGQFQCNGALALSKAVKKNPREIAQQIITALQGHDLIEQLSIAGPGFINISVKDRCIARHMIEQYPQVLSADTTPRDQKDTVIVDFASPNVAKPMHVGHLRSAIIGDTLQRLFRYLGHHVISDNHVGDWGTQMGMLIEELKRNQPDLIYFKEHCDGPFPAESPITLTELEALYPVASKRCKENEDALALAIKATDELQKGRPGYRALWKHFVALSIATLRKDFDALDIHFDHWLGESFYTEAMEKLVLKLKENQSAVISNHALIIEVSTPEDKEPVPPVMLVKSGGGFLYATSDLATIDYRVNTFRPNRILYVVDQRQGLHFTQVFRAARKTAIAPPELRMEHIGFGTVNGSDGKPFKTREGGVMKLADLIQSVRQKAMERMHEAGIGTDFSEEEKASVAIMIGMAALKFADLVNHRTSNYVFDLDKFTRFEGKTGPYLLYTAVRIKSILRKAHEQGLSEGEILPPTAAERPLLLLMSQFIDVLQQTAESCAPNNLCEYIYLVAQEFNRFYKECHIISEKDPAKQQSWLAIIRYCLTLFEKTLHILGIAIPERM